MRNGPGLDPEQRLPVKWRVMRAMRLCPALLFALLVASCGSAPEYTPEQLARMTFRALQSQDRGAFVILGATTDDVEDLFGAMEFSSAKEKKYMLDRRKESGGAPGTQTTIRGVLERSFERVRDRSAKDFNWKTAVFGEVIRVGKSVRWGIASEDIMFTVKAKDGTAYRFRLDDCVVMGGRRFLTDRLSYSGKLK